MFNYHQIILFLITTLLFIPVSSYRISKSYEKLLSAQDKRKACSRMVNDILQTVFVLLAFFAALAFTVIMNIIHRTNG
ncbi:putative uncharacterized protein [Waddlia chondrophila 2032/99]|uniref:Uncharacterized protein n=2 Tax=Waddlia chondrophila TaxID=71667 RepID=D6YTC2_WADCW|nr:hypothetical protein wcw_0006 [Waddlia chondrophila WSU 86-1044]CCB91625.1 putative uncharacterized protein [Waddlia chondrophila 2032/99]